MTESEVRKAVEESKGIKLCNIASVASLLNVEGNIVKKSFPQEADSVDFVVTGETDDGSFRVVLTKHNSGKSNAPKTVWSLHGYQKNSLRKVEDIKSKNEAYMALLEKRPEPLIKSQGGVRERMARVMGDKQLAKEKASAQAFFHEKKPEVKQEKKTNGSIGQMFSKQTKKESTKNDASKVKSETIKTEKSDKIGQTKPAADKNDDDNNKNAPKTPKNISQQKQKETPKDKKATPKTERNSKVKVEKNYHCDDDDEMDVDTPAKKQEDVEENVKKSSHSAQKRKQIGSGDESDDGSAKKKKRVSKKTEDSDDDEDVVPAKKKQMAKKKMRAVLESDSDDELEENKESKSTPEKSPINKQSPKDTEKKTKTSRKKNEDKSVAKLPFKKESEDNEQTTKENKHSDKGATNGRKRRRRVLKEVTHTFKDEEGFLQTTIKKEMVSETDSDSDETPKSNGAKQIPSKTAGKSVATTPKGQSSLFAFFKKS